MYRDMSGRRALLRKRCALSSGTSSSSLNKNIFGMSRSGHMGHEIILFCLDSFDARKYVFEWVSHLCHHRTFLIFCVNIGFAHRHTNLWRVCQFKNKHFLWE